MSCGVISTVTMRPIDDYTDEEAEYIPLITGSFTASQAGCAGSESAF